MVKKRDKRVRQPKTVVYQNNSTLFTKDEFNENGSTRPYLSSKLVLVAVLMVLVAVVIVLYRQQNIYGGEETIMLETAVQQPSSLEMESHQSVSLFTHYSVNYSDLLRLRHENMNKYDFEYNLHGVDKRSNLTLQEYRDVYDGKWPVVVTDVVPQWKAINWSRNFLKENYGDQNAIMNIVSGTLDSTVALALPIELFYKKTQNARANSWTYVADEFFITQRPELHSEIGETIYLKENFYPLFPREVRPWDAQLLWGTAFSRSTLHNDPYNWTGTNAVISGIKRWKLYPPGQDQYLHVKPESKCGFPLECNHYISAADAFNPDFQRFPKLKQAKALEFDQLPGELLLIPTGWFHQAYNLEETIAFSSQVMNRNNFRIVLEEILKITSNLNRSRLPPNIDSLPPAEQVKVVMSLLPNRILQQGQEVTERVKQQIAHGNMNFLQMIPVDAAIRT